MKRVKQRILDTVVCFVVAVFVAGPAQSAEPLVWSTFLGGVNAENTGGLFIDFDGNIWVGGVTQSPDFPVTDDAHDSSFSGSSRGFIAQLSPTGELLYSTFLGDSVSFVSMDRSGSVYAVGTVTDNLTDVFVAKLDLHGGQGGYWLTFGGSGMDLVTMVHGRIAVDASGALYVAGYTTSDDFPVTAGALQTNLGGTRDGFVVKVAPDGSHLEYATYLGGSGDDFARCLEVNEAGEVFVVGGTASPDFPVTADAFDRDLGGAQDAFAVRLNASGSALVYGTYLGGSGSELAASLVRTSADEVYVLGRTDSADFPSTVGAYDTTLNGGTDLFVACLDAEGMELLASTYLGGSAGELDKWLCSDPFGGLWIGGDTRSNDFPLTPDAFQSEYGSGGDVVVARLTANLGTLSYASYIGGPASDGNPKVEVDDEGALYVMALTASPTFPTTAGAFGRTLGGPSDAFVLKLALGPYYWDTDMDGLSDAAEAALGTDPAAPDSDGDGLADGDEVNLYHTDPLVVDTDGDGLTDGDEIGLYQTSPLERDTDGDGLLDGHEVATTFTNPTQTDTDGDGFSDGDEFLRGYNPRDSLNGPPGPDPSALDFTWRGIRNPTFTGGVWDPWYQKGNAGMWVHDSFEYLAVPLLWSLYGVPAREIEAFAGLPPHFFQDQTGGTLYTTGTAIRQVFQSPAPFRLRASYLLRTYEPLGEARQPDLGFVLVCDGVTADLDCISAFDATQPLEGASPPCYDLNGVYESKVFPAGVYAVTLGVLNAHDNEGLTGFFPDDIVVVPSTSEVWMEQHLPGPWRDAAASASYRVGDDNPRSLTIRYQAPPAGASFDPILVWQTEFDAAAHPVMVLDLDMPMPENGTEYFELFVDRGFGFRYEDYTPFPVQIGGGRQVIAHDLRETGYPVWGPFDPLNWSGTIRSIRLDPGYGQAVLLAGREARIYSLRFLSAEGDEDADGVTNAEETHYGTNPLDPADDGADADGDGLTDRLEALYRGDPAHADTDGDGLLDGHEILTFGTDLRNPDTDGDSYTDHDEILRGTDPLDATSHPEGLNPSALDPTWRGIRNGEFEGASLDHWSTLGIVNSYVNGHDDGAYANSSVLVSPRHIEAFAGVAPDYFRRLPDSVNYVGGSAIRQTFHSPTPFALAGRLGLLTDEYNHLPVDPDLAFVLVTCGTSVVYLSTWTAGEATVDWGGAQRYCALGLPPEEVLPAGTYTLTIGVLSARDFRANTSIYVDSIAAGSAEGEVWPEQLHRLQMPEAEASETVSVIGGGVETHLLLHYQQPPAGTGFFPALYSPVQFEAAERPILVLDVDLDIPGKAQDIFGIYLDRGQGLGAGLNLYFPVELGGGRRVLALDMRSPRPECVYPTPWTWTGNVFSAGLVAGTQSEVLVGQTARIYSLRFLTADGDADGDGATNETEVAHGTNPLDMDSDDDGLTDGDELNVYLTDPLSSDSENDGLTDGQEVLIYGTDPRDPDSDDDGMSDGDEVAAGRNPLNPNDEAAKPYAIVNGSFEEQTAAWNKLGNVWASRDHAEPGLENVRFSTYGGVSIARLEAFAGVAPGYFGTAFGETYVRGSALSQQFTSPSRFRLRFSYFLWTLEARRGTRAGDAFFAYITNGEGLEEVLRWKTDELTQSAYSEGLDMDVYYEGGAAASAELPAGAYRIVFGVLDATDEQHDTVGAVDFVCAAPADGTLPVEQWSELHSEETFCSSDVRFVPAGDGGPAHALVTIKDPDGEQDLAPTIVQHAHVPAADYCVFAMELALVQPLAAPEPGGVTVGGTASAHTGTFFLGPGTEPQVVSLWVPNAASLDRVDHVIVRLGQTRALLGNQARIFRSALLSGTGDEDGDGLANAVEAMYGLNPLNPADDGRDTDADGLSDQSELAVYQTDPRVADSDGDGLSDGQEVLVHGTQPLDADTDGDGLGDGDEVLTYLTNPLSSDSDGDGLTDGQEVLTYGTDPLDRDTDGDTFLDGVEVSVSTDPLDPLSTPIPKVVSIARNEPAVTNLDTVTYTVTFDKPVTGVDASDFGLAVSDVTKTALSAVAPSITTASSVFSVTVNGGRGDGTLRLNLVDDDSILYAAAFPLGNVGEGNGSFSGDTYTFDRTPPTLELEATIDAAAPAPIVVSAAFSEPVVGFEMGDVVITNGTASEFAGAGAGYQFRVTPSGDGNVVIAVPAGAATDEAGNASDGKNLTVSYDITPPTVLSVGFQDKTFTITFSEPVKGVNKSDFYLAFDGLSGLSLSNSVGSGATYTVSVLGPTGKKAVSGNGNVVLNVLDDDTIIDAAGNPLGGLGVGNGAFTSGPYSITFP